MKPDQLCIKPSLCVHYAGLKKTCPGLRHRIIHELQNVGDMTLRPSIHPIKQFRFWQIVADLAQKQEQWKEIEQDGGGGKNKWQERTAVAEHEEVTMQQMEASQHVSIREQKD